MSEFAVSLVADLEPKIDIIEQVSVYVPSLELFSGPFARDAVTFPLCNNNQVTIDQAQVPHQRTAIAEYLCSIHS